MASNHLLKTSFSMSRYRLPSELTRNGPRMTMLTTWKSALSWTLGWWTSFYLGAFWLLTWHRWHCWITLWTSGISRSMKTRSDKNAKLLWCRRVPGIDARPQRPDGVGHEECRGDCFPSRLPGLSGPTIPRWHLAGMQVRKPVTYVDPETGAFFLPRLGAQPSIAGHPEDDHLVVDVLAFLPGWSREVL